MTSKSKLLTSVTVLLGLLVLSATAFVLKDKAMEQWYLWRLEAGDSEQQWAAAAKLAQIGSKRAEQWYLKQLDSDSVEDRKLAAARLGGMRSVKAIPRLMALWPAEKELERALRGDDRYKYIIDALVNIGEPAIPSLIEKLQWQKRPDSAWFAGQAERPDSAWFACQALKRIGRPAVSALIRKLENHDELERKSAITAFAIMGPVAKDAAQALIKILTEEKRLRHMAADALGILRAEEAVPALINILKDEDRLVRLEAAGALGRIGPPAKSAIPALKALKDPDVEVRNAANKALMQIKGTD